MDNIYPPYLLILVGPTAVGKTAVAVELCQLLGAEVVNIDSLQVYQELNIGSGKPTKRDIDLAPHHLISIIKPGEIMNAARYAVLADIAISSISSRGRRVLVVGGSGFYIRALLWGLSPFPSVDLHIRRQLQYEWEKRGGWGLYQRLKKLDAVIAARLERNDKQRIIRALELYFKVGKFFNQNGDNFFIFQARYPYLIVGITCSYRELNERIEVRCRTMWHTGLVEEVKKLLVAGLSPQAQSLNSLGYRQAVKVIKCEMSELEALKQMIMQTKSYAKRQFSWFRRIKDIKWYLSNEYRALFSVGYNFWSGF